MDLLPIEPAGADVAVSRLTEPLTPDFPLTPTMAGLRWSQRVFFLGFPYGLATDLGPGADRLAFVKSAILSATQQVNDVHLVYLDGMNNPGFSGGPVVFNLDEDSQRPQVAAVIAGYRRETQPVYEGTIELANVVAGANTGIIIATSIGHVTDAIDRHL